MSWDCAAKSTVDGLVLLLFSNLEYFPGIETLRVGLFLFLDSGFKDFCDFCCSRDIPVGLVARTVCISELFS